MAFETKTELIVALRDLGYSWSKIAELVYGDKRKRYAARVLYKQYFRTLAKNGKDILQLKVFYSPTVYDFGGGERDPMGFREIDDNFKDVVERKRESRGVDRQFYEYQHLILYFFDRFLDLNYNVLDTAFRIHRLSFKKFYDEFRENVWFNSGKRHTASLISLAYIFNVLAFALIVHDLRRLVYDLFKKFVSSEFVSNVEYFEKNIVETSRFVYPAFLRITIGVPLDSQ